MKTVNDLIKELSKFDRELPVVFSDGEQGLFVLTGFSVSHSSKVYGSEHLDRVEVCVSDYSEEPCDIPY